MIKRLNTLAAWLAFAVCAASAAHALEPGDPAPGFELPGRGADIRLADFLGNTVYLDFWASWCGPCKQSFPWMNDIQARYRAKGLRVIGIDVDRNPQDAQAFLKDSAPVFDIAFDPVGRTPRAYAVKGMPTSFLIGPDGRVLMVHSGFRPEDRAALERRIVDALSAGGAR